VYDQYSIDIIQLRPIDKIGETSYNNFSLKAIENDYQEVNFFLKKEALKEKLLCCHQKQ
jgi:hypothetical protein